MNINETSNEDFENEINSNNEQIMNDVLEEENQNIEEVIENHFRTCDKNENIENEVNSFKEEIMNNEFEERNDNIKEAIDNHVITSNENEILVDDKNLQNNVDFKFDKLIPTTNAEKLAIKIEERIEYGYSFSGSNVLNNVGSALERKKYDFTKSQHRNHNIKK